MAVVEEPRGDHHVVEDRREGPQGHQGGRHGPQVLAPHAADEGGAHEHGQGEAHEDEDEVEEGHRLPPSVGSAGVAARASPRRPRSRRSAPVNSTIVIWLRKSRKNPSSRGSWGASITPVM